MAGYISLYQISRPFTPTKRLLPSDVRSQIEQWEVAKAEHDIKLYSELKSIFMSIQASQNVSKFPDEVYEAIVNCVTNPTFHFLIAITETEIPDLELSLVTIFSYSRNFRGALKFCIFDFAKSIENDIFESNNFRVKFPLEFMKREMLSFDWEPIKGKLAGFERENVVEVLGVIEELATGLPSIVRFICRCVFDAFVAFRKDQKLAKKAVLGLFVWRFLGEVLMDFSDVIRGVFVGEEEGKGEVLCERLLRVSEENDWIERPTWEEVVQAVEVVRRNCIESANTLAFTPVIGPAFLIAWLEGLVEQ